MQISHRKSVILLLSQPLIADEKKIAWDMPNDLAGRATTRHLIQKSLADIRFSFLSYCMEQPSALGVYLQSINKSMYKLTLVFSSGKSGLTSVSVIYVIKGAKCHSYLSPHLQNWISDTLFFKAATFCGWRHILPNHPCL